MMVFCIYGFQGMNVYEGKEEIIMQDIIRSVQENQLRTDIPKLEIGATVRVFVKVVEGTRERLQAFEGTIIRKQGGGLTETFTVRRVSYGVGVERTFPIHSPRIDRVEVMRQGRVRRAKLYYLRGRTGKSARLRTVQENRQ